MYSLYSNTTGGNNTASGNSSLYFNTTGTDNTANGYQALSQNTVGIYNTANGSNALASNTTGNNNIANGYSTLGNNLTGSNNVANGYLSLSNNLTGSRNTANGHQALYKNTSASYSVADGYQSLYNSKGKYNIGLGYRGGFNLTTGSYNIAIGNQGVAAESGAIRIGTSGLQKTAYIAGINGVTSSAGVAVYIDANGQLGTVTSSRRFKNDIKSMGNVSEKLLQLRPVTFSYKVADEKGGHPVQYGLIAEEVAKVFPNLVQYDKAGKPFTVYYHLLTPMLLNELQKANRRVQAMNTSHKSEVETLNTKVANMEVSHKAEITSLRVELAQQKRLLNQLAAYIQNGKNNAPPQKANFVQH
ncbi:MAG: tail fiber domain-containing protein [Armatimonadetes bacterium]|nr:tail fiber domain-containing protein [Armatimonadota bacterium]